MKYLVMETHPAYVVLLDEDGRYLKAANLSYQVGDTVADIIPMRESSPKIISFARPLAGLAVLAACICIIFFGYYQPNFTAYGTLRIQINPDVEMTISRTDRVLRLEGLNQDGIRLIEDYDYRGKSWDTATDQLVERAIDMGYLSGGDTISISVSSKDAAWQAEEETQVLRALENRYGRQVVIHIGEKKDDDTTDNGSSHEVEMVIPVKPKASPSANPAQPSSDTDYGPNNDGATDYDDTDYGPNNDGVTDYSDTDYGPNNRSAADYNDTDYGPDNDGVTDYGDSPYAAYSNGATDYDNREQEDDNGDGDDN